MNVVTSRKDEIVGWGVENTPTNTGPVARGFPCRKALANRYLTVGKTTAGTSLLIGEEKESGWWEGERGRYSWEL